MACIFNHMDKGGLKFPMMIYKNLYLKDSKYNISDDKTYLHTLITDKQWDKFMDVYTLNRIIRIITNDSNQNSMLSDQVTTFITNILFRFNRVMFCWTVMSISNLFLGILSFLFFISSTERPLRYLLNTALFAAASFFTTERLIVLLLCELCYPIVDSKILTDAFDDTCQSLKRGFLNIYYGTRLESVLMSFFLFYTSYYGYNMLRIITVCIINLVIMFRLAYQTSFFSEKSMKTVDKIIQYPAKILGTSKVESKVESKVNTPSDLDDVSTIIRLGGDLNDLEPLPTTSSTNTLKRTRSKQGLLISNIPHTQHVVPIKPQSVSGVLNGIIGVDELSVTQINPNGVGTISKVPNEIENTDILLILKDRIKNTLKNNLLIRVINPFVELTTHEMLRIFAHVFILLLMSSISSFDIYHIVPLPIIVQNAIDMIF